MGGIIQPSVKDSSIPDLSTSLVLDVKKPDHQSGFLHLNPPEVLSSAALTPIMG